MSNYSEGCNALMLHQRKRHTAVPPGPNSSGRRWKNGGVIMELTKRHRESLEALQYECDYEDRRIGDDLNFIRWEQLHNSHGSETRAELVEAGYAIAGQNRWSGNVGYRITEAGREALKRPAPPKPPRRPSRLKPMPPRLGAAPSRFGAK